ncbi:MAG TPA: YdcF family protein [Bacteroidia bacterium]|nr:YdcF family protein [Bacteroidia bacterium]
MSIHLNQIFIKFLKFLIRASGVLFIFLFVLSLTDLPFNLYHWLGTGNSTLRSKPDAIVLLGGSGMPSPDGFIRCYYASEAAQKFEKIPVIIALPFAESDSNKQLMMMRKELILHEVDSNRIRFEPFGFNTHSQAINIATQFGPKTQETKLVLITSPEHMYRSVRTFQKAGFNAVGGIPSFEKPIPADKVKDKSRSKDKRVKDLDLRYNIWSYLHYEILVIKEFFAITYYKIKGWI